MEETENWVNKIPNKSQHSKELGVIVLNVQEESERHHCNYLSTLQ